MLEPRAMAKAKPKNNKGEEADKGKGEGKGKGKPPAKKESDYEHAGVGTAIHRNMMKHVEEVREVNGRVIALKLKTAGGDMVFMSVYGPTAESKETDKDASYDTLTKEMELEKTA